MNERMPPPMRRPAAAGVAGVFALALVLAACAPDPAPPGPSASATPTTGTSAQPSPSPSATAAPFAEGVIGRGGFSGEVTGTVEVLEHDDDSVTFRVKDLKGAPADASVLLQPGSQALSACADVDVVDYGPVSYVPDGAQRPVDLTRPFDDPTIWQAVVLAVPDEGECGLRVVARAPLEWKERGGDSPRARLADIVDGGERPGATGAVSAASGRVYAYRVAPGDVLSVVAERFGVRIADILALNPFRDDPLDTGLYADEVLNLALDQR